MSGADGAPGAAASVRESVARAAAAARVPAWLVGGAVRDELLRREVRDVDVALGAGPERLGILLEALAGDGFLLRARHERFGTATLDAPGGLRTDLACTRREHYPQPASLPVVATGASIAEDLARRDFTIHAMARPLGAGGEPGALIDPHGGERDLATRTLRLLHDLSLVDDPTRIFRAARYAARLGFTVAPEFASQLSACLAAGALDGLSPDRLRRALGEVLEEGAAPAALALLKAWGVLDALAPGLGGDEAAAARRRASWSALFEGLAPAQRGALAARLNFSRALRRTVGLGR